MKYVVLVLSCFISAFSDAVRFQIRNNNPDTLWIGTLGYLTPLETTGFVLEAEDERTIESPDNWSGYIWARSFNDETQHCETGDCGNKLECGSSGETPPATVVEISLRNINVDGQDYYDVSLVRGFNVKASISPIDGEGACETIECLGDVNGGCPDELKLTGSNGQTIACHSSCTRFNTNQYCCRGSFASSRSCKPDTWEINSAGYFKQVCPKAKSYPYDRHVNSAQLTCLADTYEITFE